MKEFIKGWISSIFILMLILSSLYLLAWSLGISLFVVEGRSMEETLHEGDLVIIRKVMPEDIHVGDIIVYRAPINKLIIHRVVEKIATDGTFLFITKGDNVANPDPWVIHPTNIIGKVIMPPIPKIGMARILLSTEVLNVPIGIWLSLLIITLVISLDYLKWRVHSGKT